MEGYRSLARVYGALAHPVRLYILRALAQEEACVCHLTALLGRPQPYISQQLAILREAGLITDRSEGNFVFYRVADDQVLALIELGQGLLPKQGEEVDLPPIAQGPLPGCPCPHCQGE